MTTKFDDTAAAALPSPSDNSNNNTNTYEARRSQRVSGGDVVTDGDVWQEKLAVCEGSTDAGEPRLLIRSYYRNTRTLDRVWDEPPSGAGTVLHADPEMRSKAELQKQELQLTLEMIPPEEDEVLENEEGGGKNSSSSNNNKPKKKGLFGGRFARKKKEKKDVDTSRDLNLQRAIARSMADQNGRGGGSNISDEPLVYFDDGEPMPGLMQQQQQQQIGSSLDEDIELAKALSMSVETAQQESMRAGATATATGAGQFDLTEEEMFQRALEKSREESLRGATGVASLPEPSLLHDFSSSSFTSLSVSPQSPAKKGVKTDPNEGYYGEDNSSHLDQKLPAVPYPPETSLKKFDPYG